MTIFSWRAAQRGQISYNQSGKIKSIMMMAHIFFEGMISIFKCKANSIPPLKVKLTIIVAGTYTKHD